MDDIEKHVRHILVKDYKNDPVGRRRYFVGYTQIPEPKNHGYSPEVFEVLKHQAGYKVFEKRVKGWVSRVK